MTTTISPSTGVGLDFLQLGPGATTSYGAIDLRRLFFAPPMQEGVLGSAGTSYKVTLSSGMILTIAASSGDGAVVQGDSITAQGLYFVPPHSAAITETVTAAHATLPRIDQVVLEVLDANHDGGASNLARTRIVAGTATAGATLDNRTGATALPNSAIRLADVLVPAAAASILAANIRDRRQWARGANFDVIYTSGTLLATTSTTFAELNSALSKRVELSGVDVQWTLRCNITNTFAVANDAGPWVDGAVLAVANGGGKNLYGTSVAASQGTVMAVHQLRSLTVGSHLISAGGDSGSGSGTATFAGDTTRAAQMTVRELVAQNANNT